METRHCFHYNPSTFCLTLLTLFSAASLSLAGPMAEQVDQFINK